MLSYISVCISSFVMPGCSEKVNDEVMVGRNLSPPLSQLGRQVATEGAQLAFAKTLGLQKQ
jgi:hypothetical protein